MQEISIKMKLEPIEANKTVVYYDGICKLCLKEINYYKKIAPPLTFIWIDIARNGQALLDDGITQEQALRYLHIKDASGKLHVGVDAFQLLWSNLPRWRLLSLLLEISPVRYVARIAYRLFADRRFKRLTHCQLSGEASNTPDRNKL